MTNLGLGFVSVAVVVVEIQSIDITVYQIRHHDYYATSTPFSSFCHLSKNAAKRFVFFVFVFFLLFLWKRHSF